MKIRHRPYHWVLVALVLLALLLTLSEVHGQATGAAGAFEARPAIAGAQGGLGAQAGVPQGGTTNTDMSVRKEVAPKRDQSLAKDQRSTKKAVRGVKRSISRARHGTSPVDAGK